MGRMNVLYLADRNNDDQYYPLGPYVEKALHHRHDVRFFVTGRACELSGFRLVDSAVVMP